MMPARPYSRAAIESGDVHANGLISINPVVGPDVPEKELPFGNFEEVLRLQFDDVPYASVARHGKTYLGPTVEDVTAAIEFGRRLRDKHAGEPIRIAVHCMHGKSRSAAIALAINMDLCPGDAAKVVKDMLSDDTEQQRCFNPLIISIADDLLKTYGGLNRALMDHCAPYRRWKRYWDF